MEIDIAATPPARIDLGDLVVRRWRLDDVDSRLGALIDSHEHLHQWMAWAAEPPTREDQRLSIEISSTRWPTPGGGYLYGIFTAAGEVVGGIGLHDRVAAGALEIGYWCHVAHTGRGVVTRAARALTAAALALPHIERVEIRCDAANVRSAAVPRRLGYRLVETGVRAAEAPCDSGRYQVWATTAHGS
ncbi:GNAT family N-acetyltransferase [Nocardia sp. NPDC023988]|uniref:GNAT family N-acetyltransferase n=1 Tax=unclassified Nocardia TaxID=2637762 RepID=UPI003400BD01